MAKTTVGRQEPTEDGEKTDSRSLAGLQSPCLTSTTTAAGDNKRGGSGNGRYLTSLKLGTVYTIGVTEMFTERSSYSTIGKA